MKASPPYSWNVCSCEISETTRKCEKDDCSRTVSALREESASGGILTYLELLFQLDVCHRLYLFKFISIVDTSESTTKTSLDRFIRRLTQHSCGVLKLDDQFINHLVLNQKYSASVWGWRFK